jgi:antitoxin YefM
VQKTTEQRREAILMSEEDYEGLMETVHLLRSPANAARLLRSIYQADEGKLAERDLSDDPTGRHDKGRMAE